MILGLIDGRLPEANALKNSLVGATSLASTGVLVTNGPVVWSAAVPLTCGAFLGSLVGPTITRRVPAIALRRTVAALSLVLAVQLWLSAA